MIKFQVSTFKVCLNHIKSKGLGRSEEYFFYKSIFEMKKVRDCCEVTTATNRVCSIWKTLWFICCNKLLLHSVGVTDKFEKISIWANEGGNISEISYKSFED